MAQPPAPPPPTPIPTWHITVFPPGAGLSCGCAGSSHRLQTRDHCSLGWGEEKDHQVTEENSLSFSSFTQPFFLSPCAGMLTHSSSLIMESKSLLGELPAYPSLLVFLSLSLGLLSPSLQAPYLPPSCPRTSSLSHASPLSLLPCFPLSPLTQWLEVSEV